MQELWRTNTTPMLRLGHHLLAWKGKPRTCSIVFGQSERFAGLRGQILLDGDANV